MNIDQQLEEEGSTDQLVEEGGSTDQQLEEGGSTDQQLEEGGSTDQLVEEGGSIDQQLDEVAAKSNLSVLNVKSILHVSRMSCVVLYRSLDSPRNENLRKCTCSVLILFPTHTYV